MKHKVSDLIVRFFEGKGVDRAYGIIGSANSHIFDSIYFNSKIRFLCNHHEQACTMAVQTHWKMTGTPTFALVTAGGGSTNAITGVVSAWADSIPCLVLSGQENARYIDPEPARRMYGIQGYDSPFMVGKVTKYGARIMDPARVLFELEKAWHIATTGRPGPCWIDIPMNVQGALVEEADLVRYEPPAPAADPDLAPLFAGGRLAAEVEKALAHLRAAERPLLWLGVGVRMAGAVEEVKAFVEKLGVPALVTWSAIDLLDSDHPLVVGRAGTYGQRAANLILQSADHLLAIGTRLAIPQVGYEIKELCREARHLAVVDVDGAELAKYPEKFDHPIPADAGAFLREALRQLGDGKPLEIAPWREKCAALRERFPWIGPEHADPGGFINSYPFMERLTPHLKPDQAIVTDMGTALLSGHQALRIKPPQRLLTSQGLGEMGFGLPGAIGASFAHASGRGEVLCLNCDGGMMMNLQELQTVVHYRLPIKIVVFNNDGYLMIKHTQKAILQGRYAGTDAASGVSCPDYAKVAAAFGIPSLSVRTWDEFDSEIPKMQAHDGPILCEVFMHPEQFFHPKLSLAAQPDGTLVSPPLEDLSPLLPRETLRESLSVPLHEKSARLRVD